MEQNEREVKIGDQVYHLRKKYPLRRVNTAGQAMGVELFTVAFEQIDFLPVFKSPTIQLAVLAEILEEPVDETILDEMTGADFMQLFSVFFIEASLSTLKTSSGENYFPVTTKRILDRQGPRMATSSSAPSLERPLEIQGGPNGFGTDTQSGS